MKIDKYLTPAEVMEILRFKRVDMVYRLIQSGQLRALKMNRHKILIPEAALSEYINAHMT